MDLISFIRMFAESDAAHRVKTTSRKRAERAVKAHKCQTCGSSNDLQRHHSDISGSDSVRVLCRKCHKALHDKTASWGRGKAKTPEEREKNLKRYQRFQRTGK